MSTIKTLQKEAHKISCDNGFYTDGEVKEIGTQLMQVTAELGEALEADRLGKRAKKEMFLMATENLQIGSSEWVLHFKELVKDSYEDELADAFIRILDEAEHRDIDLDFHVNNKMNYNRTRGFKHGKLY